jgi:hypothetical protein
MGMAGMKDLEPDARADAPAPAEGGPLEDLMGGITGTTAHSEPGGEAWTQIGAGVGREAPVDAGEACVCDAAGAATSANRYGNVPAQNGPDCGPRLAEQPWPEKGPSLARSEPTAWRAARGHKTAISGPRPSPECIDVRALGRFKVRLTDDHVKGNRIDPWDTEMVCAKGTIFPHGGAQLQAHSGLGSGEVASMRRTSYG